MEIKEKEKILYQIQSLTAEDKAFVLGFMSGVAKAKSHDAEDGE